MIIDRYIIREIAKPLVVVCGILVIIFVGYRSARYLVDAAEGLLPAKTITSLILLKTAIALDVLLPITLYLCVVLTLSRLHADSEIIALSACGVSPSRVLRAVLWLSLLLATLVLSLSLYVRPWAYEKSYRLRAQAEAEFDITRLEAGRFYEGRRGTRVIFVERVGRKPNQVEGVFIQREQGDTLQVIYAKEAYQQVDVSSGQRVLVVLDGHQYKLARRGETDRVLKFEKLEMFVKDEEMTPEYRRKAAPTVQLAGSVDPMDTAEFQWRLFTPLSTVLLGLLGVPLSRAAPRRGKHANFFAAVLIYTVYYNVSVMAKTWVEQGVVGPVPGIWWVDALLAVLLLAMLFRPTWVVRLRRR